MRNKNLLIVYLLLILFILSVTSRENDTDVSQENDNVLFKLLQGETTSEHYQVMIEYITRFFCTGESYRFNHIYVERSLSTLAGDLINKINHCATASSLISR